MTSGQSRAVLRRVEAGQMPPCVQCGSPVKFRAKAKNFKVIANVYEGGKWNRVEHYHDTCYVEAGEPYGEAAA